MEKISGPGHFTDPDMLQVVILGVPNTFVKSTKPTNLTTSEQYSQMSYWAILSAPLLLSCDLEQSPSISKRQD